MKARIHDQDGVLRIEITPESYEERMLVRAFVRENIESSAACVCMFSDCVDVDASRGEVVTFGPRPRLLTTEH